VNTLPMLANAAAPYRIHRYPSELIDKLVLEDGRSVVIRPVLPQDTDAAQAFVGALSPKTRRLRFHGVVNWLPDSVLQSMTQVDYRCQLGLIAETFDLDGPRIVADARYVCADDSDEAELAIAVADEWQGLGLGPALIDRVARHAKRSGLRVLHGEVLVGNTAMEKLMQRVGARLTPDRHDASVQHVHWTL
jgi:acetyltransferase